MTLTAPAPATAAVIADGAPAVTVFSKHGCPDCVQTTRFLARRGIAYREVNVETDTAPRPEYGGRTPLDHVVETYGRRLPVVVVDAGDGEPDWWAGSRVDKIVELARRAA